MKKGLLKRISAISLAVVVAVGLFPVMGQVSDGAVGQVEAKTAEIVHSGTCGTCTWEIDNNGTLTISGGEMDDWEYEPPWEDYKDQIKQIQTTGKVILQTGENLFSNCKNLTSLDMRSFDTSAVTNMSGMFAECENLTSLDVSSFNTSHVTNMSMMFMECKELTSLDVTGFDTSAVTDMGYMFYFCRSFESLDVSKFNTSNVTEMGNMFCYCYNLKSLDVSHFDTSNVQSMQYMFSSCSKLTSLDVSSFDTSNVWIMACMFVECENLTSLDVSHFNTSNVTDMSYMFDGCKKLTSLDVSGFDTSRVEVMEHMFSDCRKLKSLDVSNFDTSHVFSIAAMFRYCESLTSLDLSSFDTGSVFGGNDNGMWGMFSFCSRLETLQVGEGWTNPADIGMTARFPCVMEDSSTKEVFYIDAVIPEGAAIYTAVDLDDVIRPIINYQTDTWNFSNYVEEVSYQDFAKFFTPVPATLLSQYHKSMARCYGFCQLIPSIIQYNFPESLQGKEIHSLEKNGEVRQWLKYGQISQMLPGIVEEEAINTNDYNGLYSAIKHSIEHNGSMVIIAETLVRDDGTLEYHEVMPASIIKETENEVRFDIYDCNYPDHLTKEGDPIYKTLVLSGENGNYTNFACYISYDYGGYNPYGIDNIKEISYSIQTNTFMQAYLNKEKVDYFSWRGSDVNAKVCKLLHVKESSNVSFSGITNAYPITSKNGEDLDGGNTLYWIQDEDDQLTVTGIEPGNEVTIASDYNSLSIKAENEANVTFTVNEDHSNAEVSLEYPGTLEITCLSGEDNMTQVTTVLDASKEVSLDFKDGVISAAGISALEMNMISGEMDDSGVLQGSSKSYVADKIDHNSTVTVDVGHILDEQNQSSTEDTKEDTDNNTSTSDTAVGTAAKVSGAMYKITSDSAVAFTKAPNKKSVTVPATVKIKGKTYKITTVSANAFKGSKIRTITIGKNVSKISKKAFNKSKATKIILKTKKLKKKTVKGSLKGSKIKTIQVKVARKKSVNKKYVKKYKKIFTKKNAGRKVAVK